MLYGECMKKYFGFIAVIVIFSLFFFLFNRNMKLYSRDYFYMDTYINVKIYCDNDKKANNILSQIDNIYKEYHELTDRYNDYGINNIYYINNNTSGDKELVIDSKLYSLIEYALDLSNDTSLFDINLGGVIDVWKKYRDSGNGVPTIDELMKANKKNQIVLRGDNKILNNHPNIDLGGISKGYTTQVVGNYLSDNGIRFYLINAGGNVLAGDTYKKDNFKIGIQDPSGDGISYVLNLKNKAVVTSGGYERNYVYDGVMYHHIISPKTLFPTNYMKSVTVISSDSGLSDFLSTTLFLMPIDDGLKFIKKYDAQALFIDNDGNIIKSEGFSYE